MTKLNTLAATLAVAVGTAGCATTSGDPFEKQAAAVPKTASATFGSTFCETKIRASNAAAAVRERLSGETADVTSTALPTSGECVAIHVKAVTDNQQPRAKGKKAGSTAPTTALTEESPKTYPTEPHFVRLDLPNCVQNNSAAASALGDGLNTLATTITQQVMRGGSADAQQAARGALNKAVKGRTAATSKVRTNAISEACKADLSEAYNSVSETIAEKVTAYAEAQGVPSTTVQVRQVPTFDPKYWGSAVPGKR
ncbi:MAG: hypothetical protein JNL76_08845 [Alphaproteobacteria bacterium]|nr:hypothetical protein [Alphaproteobacteria bacterium]